MRISLVIYDSLDTLSGGYLYDRFLVHYLREAGDDVEIISLPRPAYAQSLMHNFRPSLAQRLTQGAFDIVLQDELCHPSLYLLNNWWPGRRRVPVVSVVHHLRASEQHPAPLLRHYRRVERRYLRTVDGFVFNSETTRAAVEREVGRAESFIIAPPAADHVPGTITADHLAQRALRDDRLRVLFAGNIMPRKGLHDLLAALARLPANLWHLSVAGDTAHDRAYVAQMAAWSRKVLPEHAVTWHGRVPDHTLWNLMTASDLLVVPSSYEGFGIVYLEGMAFGLPAIATTAGGAQEIITDGENGFLVTPGNAGQLAAHLRLLQSDRRRLLRMSQAARARFLAAPTWNQSMARARRFLLEIREN